MVRPFIRFASTMSNRVGRWKGTRKVRKPIRPRTMGDVRTSSTSFDVAIKHTVLAKKKKKKQIEQEGWRDEK